MDRKLGATGLRVTAMGLGLAALGRPAYITAGRDADLGAGRDREAMQRRTHEVLDAAYDAGLRYVDTARSYGLAEAFLASWLRVRHLAPGTITIGSKWGYRYVGEWRTDVPVHEIKDHSVTALRRQLAESCALLGDYLSLYQVHSATLESGVLDDKAVLAELVSQGDTGLAIGLTVSGPRQADVIRAALEAEVDGVNPFRTVQATWNILEPSCGPALAEAHAAGWGVIVKEPVANGRLTRYGAEGLHPVVEQLAQQHDAGVDQIALAAVLRQPWVDVVLSGAVTVDELRSNVGANVVTLGEQDVAQLSRVAEPPVDYWRYRSSLPWS
jgi:aryl-alcohol dehydrogenase-like predicted oxidoreductase